MNIKSPSSSKKMILPFLKWAGGKRWFIAKHSDKFPKKYTKYIEPFLGSGAAYFYLQPAQAILSDTNADLISTYCAIQKNWKRIIKILEWHHEKHSAKHYYEIRERKYTDEYYRASKFIYLNRTCWNGLYRVNLSGAFNVPIGTKTQVLLDSDSFSETSALLKNARLQVCDFEESINEATAGDFIFADPPYTALHKNNGFLKYNDKIFCWDDQVRLFEALMQARDRGVHVMLTNGDHKSIRDLFSPLGKIYSVERSSVIAGDSRFRNMANEIIVCTWRQLAASKE